MYLSCLFVLIVFTSIIQIGDYLLRFELYVHELLFQSRLGGKKSRKKTKG